MMMTICGQKDKKSFTTKYFFQVEFRLGFILSPFEATNPGKLGHMNEK